VVFFFLVLPAVRFLRLVVRLLVRFFRFAIALALLSVGGAVFDRPAQLDRLVPFSTRAAHVT
jgi:hypothetical protein